MDTRLSHQELLSTKRNPAYAYGLVTLPDALGLALISNDVNDQEYLLYEYPLELDICRQAGDLHIVFRIYVC